MMLTITTMMMMMMMMFFFNIGQYIMSNTPNNCDVFCHKNGKCQGARWQASTGDTRLVFQQLFVGAWKTEGVGAEFL